MTFARYQCSKLMSRDMGLIGLLRYLPLAQFTKARPVDSLGPCSLAFPRNRFCHGPRLPTTHGCTAHTMTTRGRIRVPARLFESPRHSGATDEGVTPQLLCMDLPGALEDGRAHEDIAWAKPWPANWHRRRGPRLARKVQRSCCTRQG